MGFERSPVTSTRLSSERETRRLQFALRVDEFVGEQCNFIVHASLLTEVGQTVEQPLRAPKQ